MKVLSIPYISSFSIFLKLKEIQLSDISNISRTSNSSSSIKSITSPTVIVGSSKSKSVISEPQKVKKHSKNFTVYVKGNEVYDKNTAEDIYNKLSSLPVCMKLNIHDTDPKNNPQMPKKYKL